MTTPETGRAPRRKAKRSVLARGAQWSARQILFQDGGLLTTLRSLAVAALLAATARFLPHDLPGTGTQTLLFVLPAAIGLSIIVVVVLRWTRARGRGRDAASTSPDPDDAAIEPAASHQPADHVVEIRVYIEMAGKGPDDRP
jgi:hypothetical protein